MPPGSPAGCVVASASDPPEGQESPGISNNSNGDRRPPTPNGRVRAIVSAKRSDQTGVECNAHVSPASARHHDRGPPISANCVPSLSRHPLLACATPARTLGPQTAQNLHPTRLLRIMTAQMTASGRHKRSSRTLPKRSLERHARCTRGRRGASLHLPRGTGGATSLEWTTHSSSIASQHSCLARRAAPHHPPSELGTARRGLPRVCWMEPEVACESFQRVGAASRASSPTPGSCSLRSPPPEWASPNHSSGLAAVALPPRHAKPRRSAVRFVIDT